MDNIKEQITKWYAIKNKEGAHPPDHERFYEIVIKTKGSKLDEGFFKDALNGISEDELTEIYKCYELLYDFMIFFINNDS